MHDRGASPTADAIPGDITSAGGDELSLTFNGLRDELISTLWYMLGNRDDACDAAQDAFLKCWKSRDGLGQVTNLRAWIFRVAINTARDVRRSAYRRKVRPLLGEDAMYADTAAPPGERIEEQEDLARLRSALAGLRDEEKEVFLLRQNGGLTYEQIAEARSSPVGTVKTQMRTALIKLRKVLAQA